MGGLIPPREGRVRVTSAFTRVFDALWRASKDDAAGLGPSPFEARRECAERLRVTGLVVFLGATPTHAAVSAAVATFSAFDAAIDRILVSEAEEVS